MERRRIRGQPAYAAPSDPLNFSGQPIPERLGPEPQCMLPDGALIEPFEVHAAHRLGHCADNARGMEHARDSVDHRSRACRPYQD
jgi:hypothetical protein